MFVRMIERRTVSTNGWNQVLLEAGQRYEISDNLASSLIRQNVAKEIHIEEVETEVSPPEPEEAVVVQAPPTLETKPDPVTAELDRQVQRENDSSSAPPPSPTKKRKPRRAKAETVTKDE